MQLYNGTGCLVFLIGSVTAMPVIANSHSDAVIIVSRKRHSTQRPLDKVENYRVILNKKDACRIIQFGFPGMTISVRGDFCAENKTDIVAEKIDFMDFPSSTEFDDVHFTQAEMSYWFARDGSMRKELLYVH